MVNSQTEATLAVVGLEKALAKMENFLLDFRASRASPLMTFPTFDGSGALAWLARAEQYFIVSKTPPENRLSVAMVALAGPALPWIQLLMRRIPNLSWDRFTQEMMNRFGDIIPQESRVPCNSSKRNSEDLIAAVCVAKNQPKFPPISNGNTAAVPPSLPTMTAPLLSSSPSTTAQQEMPAINTSTNHPDLGTTKDNSAPLPVQHPFLPPVRMTLPSPTTLPTPASIFCRFSLRLVPAAGHQSTPMVVPFSDSLFSSAGAPFSYLVMLRFLHIVGHLLWFDALATIRKHEFEPPPDRVMCFEF